MTIWQRFQDPTWRSQAEKLQHKNAGGTWQVERTDDKKVKQHKLRVTDFLFKSNLTEELLLKHPTPDDVKFFQDIRRCDIWDYFDPSDMAKIAHMEKRIVRQFKSLTEKDLKVLNDSISRAKRLQHKDIKRIGAMMGKENYENYKQEVKKVYSDTK